MPTAAEQLLNNSRAARSGGRRSSSKTAAEELLERRQSSSSKKTAAESLLGGGAGDYDESRRALGRADTPDERLAALEDIAASQGYEPPGRLKSLGMTVLDILSRGNYAAAGAAEELFTERGGGGLAALKRAGREVFSGLPGVQGDKEGFGQVLEQSGVGTGGSLSDIAPFLYNDTGEGLAFQRGGWADPTARGAGGLALDIVFDPINLLSAGVGKGVTVAGKSLPLTRGVTQGIAKGASRVIKSSEALTTVHNSLGKIFNRDWVIRNLPGMVRLKQAHLNRQTLAEATLKDELGRSPIAALGKKAREQLVTDIDNGVARTKYANDPKMLAAVDWAEQFHKNIADAEVAEGLLKPESVRQNYIGHFYDNTPEELRIIARARASVFPDLARFDPAEIGRHKELRAFDTLDEAVEWSKKKHADDPRFPILKPVRDPLKIMERRGLASIEALEFRQYYREIAAKYPVLSKLPYTADNFFELTNDIPVSPGEAEKITGMLGSSDAKPAFDTLSQNGKKEYMRQRLLQTSTKEEAMEVLHKYGVDNAPKQTRLTDEFAEDGTPYVPIDLPGTVGAEIPASLADDLKDMTARTLASRELNHMLRYFDRANNVFKAFVTVPFPAFHFRNAYSNLALGFADVGMSILNPGRHFDAIAAMKGAEGGFTSKVGEALTYKGLQKEMREGGVLQSGRALLEYTGTQGIDRLATVGGKIKAAPRRLGQTIENEARAALYTVYRRRGMDAASAAERVNQFLFDYTNLSRVEQDVFKRMIPFYTFARKNLERQFRNVLDKPGLTAAQVKAVRGRYDENEEMTTWEGNSFKLRLNKDGNTLTTLSGIDLPFKQLDLIWRGSVQDTARQNLGMLSPILQAPMVAAFGQVPFTGRSTERAESGAIGRVVEKMPSGVQKWMGYRKETDAAGRPRYTFEGDKFYALFQSWALSRVVSTTDRQFRQLADDPQWGPVLLDAATGLRFKQLNLDQEKAKRQAERLRYLEKWGREKGFLKQYPITYAPKEK